LTTLFLLLSVAGSTTVAADGSLDIFRSDVSGFHFVYRLDGLPPAAPLSDSTGENYRQTVSVGIPFAANVTVSSARGRDAVALPTPGVNIPLQPLVELSDRKTIRGRQLVTIIINPVQGDQYYREVEIELTFHGGMTVTGFTVPDPRFDRVFGSALANWEEARDWPKPSRSMARLGATSPFGDENTWYKIAVQSTGLVKVTLSDLAAAGLRSGSLASETIRLYNGGGQQLPMDNADPRPGLTEVALLIRDGGDGFFDAADTLYFYGEAVNRWIYEANLTPHYESNRYTAENVYWLAISSELAGTAQRMATVDATPSGLEDTVVTTYRHRVHIERDSLLFWKSDGRVRNFYRLFWTNFTAPSFFVSTANVVDDGLDEIFVAAVTSEIYPDTLFDLTVNGAAAVRQECAYRQGCTFSDATLREGLNELEIRFGSGSGVPYVDYIELGYTSLARPVSNVVDMTAPVTSPRLARIDIVDDYAADPLALNLNNPQRPVIMEGYERSAGLISFDHELSEVSPNRIMVTGLNSSLAPASITKVTVQNLRTAPGQKDLLVVTADEFVAPLQEWVDYRESDGYSIHVVTVEDIYDNFSWGLTDPAAIRDYLKFAYDSYPAPAPSMVLFVGDGNYDFLTKLGFAADNFVPPFTNDIDSSYAYSDDNYVYFGSYGKLDADSSFIGGPDQGVDMMTARWPVNSAAEIGVIVDKIKRYESPSVFGAWRTEVSLIADDEFAEGRTSEIIHTAQAETIAAQLPRYVKRDKTYAIEHPFVGRRKPSMADAIVDAFNEGRLIINYVGHGNPVLWAHEHFFTSAEDLPRLNNYDRLPLVFAASCAIGFFDEPMIEAMAEDLLVYPDGGAVAVISATRLVYSGSNHNFHKAVCDHLFGEDSLTIVEAMYAAKLQHQYNSSLSQIRNDRAYTCFGDPCLKLGLPPLRMQLDSEIDSLVALMPISLQGHVVDAAGVRFAGDGTATVSIYDADKERTYVSTDHGGSALPIDYSVNGATIYRGTVPVVGGDFELQFVPPLDIGYGGSSARIEFYFDLGTIDGVGAVDSLYVSEQIAASSDSVGPVIGYTFTGREEFVSGDVVSKGDDLIVSLTDSSGLNLTGWLGHGITLIMDDQDDQQVNLTGLFQYDENEYTSGALTYSLGGLEPGVHRFQIKAWDNANNSSMAEFSAEIAVDSEETVRDLLNFPNPMADSTNFAFHSLRPLEKFSLEIFTLSGRKIRVFDLYSLVAGYNDDIIWRGNDFSGDRVAAGVYVYKGTAHPVGGFAEATLYGKVVVVNQ
jgi:hypothetical protein